MKKIILAMLFILSLYSLASATTFTSPGMGDGSESVEIMIEKVTDSGSITTLQAWTSTGIVKHNGQYLYDFTDTPSDVLLIYWHDITDGLDASQYRVPVSVPSLSPEDIKQIAAGVHVDYDAMSLANWTYANRTLTTQAFILPAMQGSAYNGIAMQSKEVPIVAGNTPRIPFAIVDINGKPVNYTGWSAKFGAKQQPGYSDYAIALKDAVWTDASKGQGYIDLTAEDTAQVGRIYGEIRVTSGNQVATPLRFLLNIIQPVIGP